MFSRAGTSKVALCSPEAMIAQIAYAIANPVACGAVRCARDAVIRLRTFREAHGDCMQRWRAGERDMLWPPGTWQMRVVHGVRCHPPP